MNNEDINLSIESNYPLTVTVKIYSKRNFILFSNFCTKLNIHVSDIMSNTIINQPVIEKEKKELTINDILVDFNEGR